MNRSKLNYLVDCLLFLVGLGLAFSGFVRWLVLPGGGGGYGWQWGHGGSYGWRLSQEQVFLFLTRHTWTDIHRYLALALVALVIIHLYLHWSWIVSMTRQIFGGKER
ncbi:conserved hypothetical protein [Ammonifex degensii KC4]|uniref:Flavinylation-associated cytochrome domain-containing protein n=1 Tax=Ammonifex degensii (strain DSM 10501 / KC4) TaxID=429009 RepID=C9R964_AMMDK|nr:DUF4405 domain-containing protein [Ammonifex degensii]ACX52843.1 conserved hypothetical protein [Ammonifex degensii KC4]